jgi:tetratricopeptide (TPR) repeat protein
MGLGTLLEHTWNGISGLGRSSSATALFRRADQYRSEGRYREASQLVARGLAQVPDSIVGHLLSAYLCMARREIEPAKFALRHVLTLDPYQPRALLGLARIVLEEGDPDGAVPLLDKALAFYPNFPEAQALRDMIENWPSAATPSTMEIPRLEVSESSSTDRPAARDLIVTQSDGTLVRAGTDVEDERAKPLAAHQTQVLRMATAILKRAGVGALEHAAIETTAGTTLLVREGDMYLSAMVDEAIDASAALTGVGSLWATVGIPAGEK